MFSSELSEVAFSCSLTEVSFELLDEQGTAIISTTYYPDMSGNVVIYGLDKIVTASLSGQQIGEFAIYVEEDLLCRFSVIPCPVAVEMPAYEFLTSSFLTSVTNERDTAVGRYECLSVYNPEGLELTVTASYMDYDGRIVSKDFPLQPVDPDAAVSYYNVSPVRFNDFSVGELIAMVVKCGIREQRYRVLMAPPQHDPAFIFRNCFGCWETIFLCGVKETDVKFTRSAAMINGSFTNYDLDEVISYKASSGPMRYGSDRLARDLARSQAVYMLKQDGTPGDRITITECDVKTDNADDTIPSFSFTYRRASLRSVDFVAPAPYRIFDNTFDLTYE